MSPSGMLLLRNPVVFAQLCQGLVQSLTQNLTAASWQIHAGTPESFLVVPLVAKVEKPCFSAVDMKSACDVLGLFWTAIWLKSTQFLPSTQAQKVLCNQKTWSLTSTSTAEDSLGWFFFLICSKAFDPCNSENWRIPLAPNNGTDAPRTSARERERKRQRERASEGGKSTSPINPKARTKLNSRHQLNSRALTEPSQCSQA